MDQPCWTQTADKTTWCAAAGDLVLTVTKLSSGQWAATVAGPFTDERSPELGTRLAAQNWAERRAGGAR
jgi:hypothetical protein